MAFPILKRQNLDALVAFAGAALLILAFPNGALSQEDEEEFSQVPAIEMQDDVQKAVDAFNKGQEAHAAGDLEKAEEFYQEALRLVPEFAEAEFQLGSIYESRGDDERAEGAYRRAISYKQDWTLPMSALGDLLVAGGKPGEARSVLEKALEIDGLCIPCYPALTEAYLATGATEDVLRTHLQKLTILTSKVKIPASVWASKSAVERNTGDISAAKESIRRALEINPTDASALSELVQLRLIEGDFEGAVATARQLLERSPTSKQSKIRLARAELAAGRPKEALKILDTLPGDDPVVADLSTAAKSVGTNDPEALEKLLAADPEDVGILGRLCVAVRLTDPGKALEYCFKASQKEPSNIAHAIGYGAALLQLKRYPQAATILQRLKAEVPDNYTVRANLATALFQMGRFEDAREEYEWIVRREPALPAGHYLLAICYDRLERYPDALAAYQTFLRLADKNEFEDEIGRVGLRLPVLQRQIKEGKGRN